MWSNFSAHFSGFLTNIGFPLNRRRVTIAIVNTYDFHIAASIKAYDVKSTLTVYVIFPSLPEHRDSPTFQVYKETCFLLLCKKHNSHSNFLPPIQCTYLFIRSDIQERMSGFQFGNHFQNCVVSITKVTCSFVQNGNTKTTPVRDKCRNK